MTLFFKKLFEYNYHFNQELANAFEANPSKVSDRAIKLFSHIIDAQQIWNNRIAPKEKLFGVWETHEIQQFKNIDKANYEYSLFILENFDIKGTFNYANSKGRTFENRIQDALFHVINHSTYHRGQIATEFRQSGLDPLVTDYIFYKR